jgi:hypothetical protein
MATLQGGPFFGKAVSSPGGAPLSLFDHNEAGVELLALLQPPFSEPSMVQQHKGGTGSSYDITLSPLYPQAAHLLRKDFWSTK